jgi:hypothetical protein
MRNDGGASLAVTYAIRASWFLIGGNSVGARSPAARRSTNRIRRRIYRWTLRRTGIRVGIGVRLGDRSLHLVIVF